MTAPACHPLALEAWIDDPPSLVLDAGYLDRLRALPISGLRVMIDGPKPGLDDARWSAGDLERLALALPDHRRTLTVWLAPQLERVDALELALPRLLDALDTRAVEVDVEGAGGWRRKHVRGYRSLDDAGRYAVAALRFAGAESVAVTTFPGMLDACSGLMEGADELALQVYSTTSSGHSPERTGRWLRAAIARYPHAEIVAGVAAYRQPGRDDDERAAHMRRCLGEATSAGVRRACLWSGKHLVRLSARRYAAPAVGLLG